MTELSQLIGEDSRTQIQRLTRHQCHKVADSFNLQYPVGAGKDVMMKLFEAHDIDVTQSAAVQWQVMHGVDIDGKSRQEFYPVTELPNSMRTGVNSSAALNERMSAKEEEEKSFEGARIDALERENAQLRTTNEQLKVVLEERLSALEGDRKNTADSGKQKSKYWEAYHKAADMNLPVERGMKLIQIEAMIRKAESSELANA